MKKLALAVIVGGLALTGSSGPALGEIAPNQSFTGVKIGANPGTVVASGVISGVGVETNNRLQVPRGSPFQVVNSYAEGDMFETANPVSADSHFDPATCVTGTAILSTFVITGGTTGLTGITDGGEGTANLTPSVPAATMAPVSAPTPRPSSLSPSSA